MHRYEQFYLTRCPSKKSLLGEEGITIRASSLSAKEIQGKETGLLLVQITGYDLPRLQRETFENNTADPIKSPVRLARIKTDQGRVLVHSVPRVDVDTRPGNYFSHAILMAAHPMTSRQCLDTWGNHCDFAQNGGWVREDSNEKKHEQVSNLPHWAPENTGRPFSIEKSNAFEISIASQFLTPAIGRKQITGNPSARLPKRLAENTTQRAEILKRMIALFLCGNRVLLVGEPELAVILFSAITEMVPASLVSDFTFSTYESRKQLAVNSFDLANTVPGELNHDSQAMPPFLDDITIIDTYAELTNDSFVLHEDAESYANYAVDIFQEGPATGFGALRRFWSFFERFTKDQTTASFQRAWKNWFRVYQSNAQVLTKSEEHEYLNNDCLRGLLMDTPVGKPVIAKHIVSNKAAWWPEVTEHLNQGLKKEFSSMICSSLISQSKEGALSQQNIVHCMTHVLPRVDENALERIAQLKLENGNDQAEALPVRQRQYFLSFFAKQQKTLLPVACWFYFKAPKDFIRFLRRDSFPNSWKRCAIAYNLEKHAKEGRLVDAELMNFLSSRMPSLLNKALAESLKNPKLAGGIYQTVFKSFADDKSKRDFCRVSLKHLPDEYDVQLLETLVNSFSNLIGTDDEYWAHLFKQNKVFFELLKISIEASVPRTLDLLSVLAKHINPRAIVLNDPNNFYRKMLNEMAKLSNVLTQNKPGQSDDIKANEIIKRTMNWNMLGHFILGKNKIDPSKIAGAIKDVGYRNLYLFIKLIDRLAKPTPANHKELTYEMVVHCAQAAFGNDQIEKIKQVFDAALEHVDKPAQEKETIREKLESTLYSEIVGFD